MEAGFISFLPQELRAKMPSRSPVNNHCLDRLLAVCRIVRVATNKLSSGVLSLLIGGFSLSSGGDSSDSKLTAGARVSIDALNQVPRTQ